MKYVFLILVEVKNEHKEYKRPFEGLNHQSINI